MYGMPTLTNEVSTTNVLENFEASKGKDIRTMFEEIVSDYRASWEEYSKPKVSISTSDIKAAIATARESTENVGALASEVVEAGGKGMVRRTLGGILEAGETAAKVMRFTR
jgi:hypothetical protein